jgi:ATP-binding protein involved in chromosome partitioning
VGKSTVSVNLAFALAARGARVGLLDADVTGPSLPLMVAPDGGDAVRKAADGSINALSRRGVALMSYGWVAPRNARGERGGGAMRGPLAASVAAQLLRFTAWGALDFLVVDTPPGTGDVLVSLAQAVPLAAAVVVTTPQRLALSDVSRGLDALAALRVPPAALVLNMAHFTAPDTGARHYPFGDAAASPALRALADRHAIPRARTHEMPMDARLSEAGDAGTPFVLAHPGADLAAAYARLADDVAAHAEAHALDADDAAEEAAAAAADAPAAASAGAGGAASSAAAAAAAADLAVAATLAHGASVALRFSAARGTFLLRTIDASGASERALAPAAVRRACRCAACVDEVTGAPRLREADVAENVHPKKLIAQGNYGVGVVWSDGHDTGIYTFEQLAALAGGGGGGGGGGAGPPPPAGT